MNYNQFLAKIISDGINAAKADYTSKSDKERLDGSIAGFEACRNKAPQELAILLNKATIECNEAFREDRPNYWYYKSYQLEVEWVCNCVSCALVNQGEAPIVTPTARGMMRAAEVLGVSH